MFDDLPTAKAARAASEPIKNAREQKFIQQDLAKIREAIEKGRDNVTLVCPLQEPLRQALLERGYKISRPFDSDYNETSVKVSW